MMEYYEIEMDVRAINYVRKIIDDGLSLASKIANAIELSKGCVFAFFPNGMNPNNLYDFKTGGKMPESKEETWRRGRRCNR